MKSSPLLFALSLALVAALSTVAIARADAGTAPEVNKAESLYNDGKYKESLSVLNKYLATHPKDATALVDRGDDYAALDDDKSAVADYSAAIDVNPDYAYAYASRCDSLNSLQQNTQAKPDCDKAIELNPKMSYAYRVRAYIEIQQGDAKTALTDADRAVELNSNSALGFQTRCRAYVELGQNERAIQDCTDAIHLNPNIEEAYFQRGRAEIALEKWPGAIADFNQALKVSPGPNAHYWLALSYLENGDYTSALGQADSYVEAKSDDGDGYLVRARIKVKLGKPADAKEDANTALRHYRIVNDSDGAAKAQALLDSLNGAGSAHR